MKPKKFMYILPLLTLGVLAAGCGDDEPTNVVTAPSAPTGLATAVNGTSVTLAWTPGTGATSQVATVSDIAGVEADRSETFNNNTTAAATVWYDAIRIDEVK